MTYDIAVIGGGIVGLSFAMQATEIFPRIRIVVLEKESGVARHQTGPALPGASSSKPVAALNANQPVKVTGPTFDA